ncbi:beta-propeller domain-containing protein [Haloarchaeobius sp. DFWS5]|uniref:beta-propeller domain-containing protein n=1 Tax=Haloarchaeobius sp. DFWS5 TaxID=3446114 RepID=UPI003EB7DEE2
MRSSLPALAVAALLVLSAVGAGYVAVTGGIDSGPLDTGPDDSGPAAGPSTIQTAEIVQFDSDGEFETYVRRAQSRGGYGGMVAFGGGGATVDVAMESSTDSASGGAPQSNTAAGSSGSDDGASRVSETNVQESGIDEPDQLKVAPDGSTMYYADRRGYYDERGQTHVLDTSDPAAPAVVENISASGKLILVGDTLVVFDSQSVDAYDVSDRANPERVWTKALNSHVEAVRLLDGRLYMVLRQHVDAGSPCPIRPFDGSSTVPCTDVYHPRSQTDASVTYTTAVLSPETGETLDSVTFLGTYGQSATYVSENAVYMTYTKRPSYAETFGAFLQTSDLLDSQAQDRLDTLATYDISPRARQVELGAIVQDWLARQDHDERPELQQRLYDEYGQYVEERKRDLLQSGIVKVAIDGDSLSVEETGQVPGRPLNQWSMDEHEGKLRIATTVDPWGANSTNDLYTLNEDLSVAGSVEDMGVTERIYSVRFMGESAYVVTFRQIDPFYTIDLSDHANPEVKGEVKLPGFSRYLHPLGDDRMLGIGQEEGKVKATVFDVSDPNNPEVEHSKVLDARWSAVAQTHHAFLHDPEHDVFFLPTERGGYVFAEDLSQQVFVETDMPATRAAYLDDYLYVFSDSELVVVDENSWDTVTEVDLGESPYQREKNDQSASEASGADGAVNDSAESPPAQS